MWRDLQLEWEGKSYLLRADEFFTVACDVEEIVDFKKLSEMQECPQFGKIAKCYGIMLRHAGADVSDRDIYRGIMSQIARSEEEGSGKQLAALAAVSALMSVLLDGAEIEEQGGVGDDKPVSGEKMGGSPEVLFSSRRETLGSDRLTSGACSPVTSGGSTMQPNRKQRRAEAAKAS